MSSKISTSNTGKKKKATSTNSNDKSLSSSEEVISLVDASSSEEEDNGYGSDLQIIEPKYSRGGSTKSRKQHSTKKSTITKRNENSTKCLKNNPPSPSKPRNTRGAPSDMGRGKSGWGGKGMSGLGRLSSPQSMARGGRSKNSNNRRAISTSSSKSSRMDAWGIGRGKGRSGVGRKVTGAGRMLGGVGMDGGDNKHDRREMFLRSLESRRLREDIDTARSIKRQKKTGAADMDLESFTAAASGASGTGGLVNLADDDSVPSIEGDKKPAAIQLSGKQQGHTNGTIIELDNEEGSVTIDFDSMTTVGNVGGNGGVVGGTGSMSKMMEDTKDAVNASGLNKSTAKRHYLLFTSVKMHKNQSTTFPSSNTPVILFEPTSKHVSDAGTQAKMNKVNYGYLSFRHNNTELFKTSVGECTTAVEAFGGLGVDVPSNNCNSMRRAAGIDPRSDGECRIDKWNALDVTHVPAEPVLTKDLTWVGEQSKNRFISLLPSNLANNGGGGWADPTIIRPPSTAAKSYKPYQSEMLRVIASRLALALPGGPGGMDDMARLRPAIEAGVVDFRARGNGGDYRRTARFVEGARNGTKADGCFQPTLWKGKLGRHKVTPNDPELVATVQQETQVLYDIYSHCQPKSFSGTTSLTDDKAAIVAHVRGLLACR